MIIVTSTSVSGIKKAQKVRVLDQISYIYYPVQFWKNKGKDVLALFDFKSEVNAMTWTYVAQLGLKVRKIDLGIQKIDRLSLATYSIVIAAFQVFDKPSCF